jgi:hypothetical protein
MMHRILNSMNFVACLLAAVTGIVLYFKQSFYRENVSLQVMALRVPLVHEGLFYAYNLFLFTTPYIAYSILLSGMYVFGLTVRLRIRAGKLPPYPDPSPRNDLFLVVGEIHNRRKPIASGTAHWLTLPERALVTGTQSSAQSLPEKRAAACTLSPSRFSPTRQGSNLKGKLSARCGTQEKDKMLRHALSNHKSGSEILGFDTATSAMS